MMTFKVQGTIHHFIDPPLPPADKSKLSMVLELTNKIILKLKNKINCCYKPVSYTHLDVYKRQDYVGQPLPPVKLSGHL